MIVGYIRCVRAVGVGTRAFEEAVARLLSPFVARLPGARVVDRNLQVPIHEGRIHATTTILREVYRLPLPPEISAVDVLIRGVIVKVFESGEVSLR